MIHTTCSLNSGIGYGQEICKYVSAKAFHDGDTEVCCFLNGNCPWQRKVKDCDGDFIIMCDRY